MPEKKKPPRDNAIETDPRFARFAELYVELGGNTYRAAVQAGYSEQYAKKLGYRLLARLKLRVGPVLRRYSLDEVFVARKLKKLAKAKVPRWNPAEKVWDKFEASDVQIKATDMVAELLDMKPAKKIAGNGPDGTIPVVIKSSIPRPNRAEAAVKSPVAD